MREIVDVSLISIVYDPDGVLIGPIRRRVPHLAGMYREIYVVATEPTDSEIIKDLERNDCVLEFQRDGVGHEFISDARRMALSASVKRRHSHAHFIELD